MTQWEKKTPEQKEKQKEYNRVRNLRLRAEAKGLTVEAYQASLVKDAEEKAAKAALPKEPKVKKVKEPKAETKVVVEDNVEYVPVDNSAGPDEFVTESTLHPEISFKMKKTKFESASGQEFEGYKVVEKIVDYDKVEESAVY